MLKLGLKLYSNQLKRYRDEVIKLIDNNKFAYIELFVHPDSLEYLNGWKDFKKEFDLKFTLHAPHFSNGVNLADKDFEKRNNDIGQARFKLLVKQNELGKDMFKFDILNTVMATWSAAGESPLRPAVCFDMKGNFYEF